MISAVCEAFGCTPSQAKREDIRDVMDVLDYRNAQDAVALFNKGRKGVEALLKQPHLQGILLRMTRAQSGGAETIDQVVALMNEQDEE